MTRVWIMSPCVSNKLERGEEIAKYLQMGSNWSQPASENKKKKYTKLNIQKKLDAHKSISCSPGIKYPIMIAFWKQIFGLLKN